MNNIKAIREQLGLTQAALAEGMGCTQGNVGHYEQGQTIPPDAARRLIGFARTKNLYITFNDIYDTELAPAQAQREQAATETIAVRTAPNGIERRHHEVPQHPDLERRAPLAAALVGGG